MIVNKKRKIANVAPHEHKDRKIKVENGSSTKHKGLEQWQKL